MNIIQIKVTFLGNKKKIKGRQEIHINGYSVNQGSPTSGSRKKSDPRTHFPRPAGNLQNKKINLLYIAMIWFYIILRFH